MPAGVADARANANVATDGDGASQGKAARARAAGRPRGLAVTMYTHLRDRYRRNQDRRPISAKSRSTRATRTDIGEIKIDESDQDRYRRNQDRRERPGPISAKSR